MSSQIRETVDFETTRSSTPGSTFPRLLGRHRLASEAALAMLCGSAPLPASSGKTRRHRLNRGGDRAANSALHMAAICLLRLDPRTKAYAARRQADGLTKREILRCLKRYLARESYHLLT